MPIQAVIAHLGDDLPPGAVCDPFAGPATPTAVVNGDNRIDLGWDAIPGVGHLQSTALGRLPAGQPEMIASGLTGTAYSDTTVSGGVTYAYTVVGVNDEAAATRTRAPATRRSPPVRASRRRTSTVSRR